MAENNDRKSSKIPREDIIDALLDGLFDAKLYDSLSVEDQDYMDDVFSGLRESTAGHVLNALPKLDDYGIVPPLGVTDPRDAPDASIKPLPSITIPQPSIPSDLEGANEAEPEQELNAVETPQPYMPSPSIEANKDEKDESWLRSKFELVAGKEGGIQRFLVKATATYVALQALRLGSRLAIKEASATWETTKGVGKSILKSTKAAPKKWGERVADDTTKTASYLWNVVKPNTKTPTGKWYKKLGTHMSNGAKRSWYGAKYLASFPGAIVATPLVAVGSGLIARPLHIVAEGTKDVGSELKTGYSLAKKKYSDAFQFGLLKGSFKKQEGDEGMIHTILPDIFRGKYSFQGKKLKLEDMVGLWAQLKSAKVIDKFNNVREENPDKGGMYAFKEAIKAIPSSKLGSLAFAIKDLLNAESNLLPILITAFSALHDDEEVGPVNYGVGFAKKLANGDLNYFKSFLKAFDVGDLVKSSGKLFEVTAGNFAENILNHGANRNRYAQNMNGFFGFSQNDVLPRSAFLHRLNKIKVHINAIKAGSDDNLKRQAEIFEETMSVLDIALEENNFNKLFVTSSHGNSAASDA